MIATKCFFTKGVGVNKDKLASFKAPKSVVSIDTIGRAPNGKVDYKRMKAYAAEQVAAG